jgi:hypothetical protein
LWKTNGVFCLVLTSFWVGLGLLWKTDGVQFVVWEKENFRPFREENFKPFLFRRKLQTSVVQARVIRVAGP